MAIRILTGDALSTLQTLPDASVNCCVTSPPYYGLRDYGMDGQIGLEETPDAYVAAMVAVLGEVRRVLKDDGTLWLNIGDSYNAHAGQRKETDRAGIKQQSNVASVNAPSRSVAGLKAKDLIGIPWLLAFALRQPRYTGRITQVGDRVWLAAMLDGEGCFYIHRRLAGGHAGEGYYRQSDNYQCAFEVANTCEAIVRRCFDITGVGSIIRQDKDRRQPLFRWTVRSNEAKALIREIYPHLVGKQHQARIAYGITSKDKDAEPAWKAMKALHAGQSADVDYPAPPSCFEPGWYLRKDIIWSKPNPMPESVRDRPTSAHEYVFLLSKSSTYWYDADAIAEDSSRPEWASEAPTSPGNPDRKDGGGTQRKNNDKQRGHGRRHAGFNDRWDAMSKAEQCSGKRNKRSVWTIATKPFSEAHFATMAPELAETCIKAGCPKDGTVIDPFGGAGTTGLMADRLGRNAILVELNPAYVEIAKKRLEGDAGMFAEVAA